MLSKFWSKAQMRLYVPLDSFETWPDDTFSFCPKCGTDGFEILLENNSEVYIRCQVCNAPWLAKSASVHIGNDTSLEMV